MEDAGGTAIRSRWQQAAPLSLAAIVGGSGLIHLFAPQVFEPIVPRLLGDPHAWVFGSGVAELVCAAGLLVPATRGRAALATAVLFVAVFPANVQMALDSGGGTAGLAHNPVIAWGRLPLQIPLVLWVLGIASRAGAPLPRWGRGRA